MKLEDIKYDCRYFQGSIPCKPNKTNGNVCLDNHKVICSEYAKIESKILIIKLGAAGDVIRTTPLLFKIRNQYKNAYITWITDFPELVPTLNDNIYGVDKVLEWNETSLLLIDSCEYNVVINLDKDEHACALLKKKINSNTFGFTLFNNKPYPVNNLAVHKYLTGIFDGISKTNNKNYLEEIFEIAGFEYNKEEYILPSFEIPLDISINKSKKVIGLNTGCGKRWGSRKWSGDRWLELIKKLIDLDYEVILLGGPEEHEENLLYSSQTKAKYFGVKKLKLFIGLMNECDIIITSVTMAMHIAIGLKKQVVVINNIFNKNEFELFGRGIIVEPRKECKCYFSPNCHNSEYKCMDHLYVEDLLTPIISLK